MVRWRKTVDNYKLDFDLCICYGVIFSEQK